VKSPEVTVSKLVLGLKVKPLFPPTELVPVKYETWFETPLPERVPVPTQTLLIEKQPEARFTPEAKVDVAAPVTLRAAALTPAVKVEVALPVTVSMPVEREVVVALPVVALPPTVSEAIVDDPSA
jgi:hypothetical protein